MRTAAVLGSGSWGTAFARVMMHAGCSVTLWARRPELADLINETHENPDYLPGIALPPALTATSDPDRALHDADVVVLAVPSQTARQNLTRWVPLLQEHATLVSLMKGIELGTAKRMSEVISEVAGVPLSNVAVITGPNLAREIAEEQPAATVVACSDHDRAVDLQESCQTAYLRPYTNTDVVGCELGGTVKNIIALACGMAEGMGFGDNTRASIMTRGLAETARLGLALGAEESTFAGLAGLGDLVATCSSPLSRNRTFGERLGRGETLEQVLQAATQIAEGVASCRSVLDLAHAHGVDMPITEAVVAICHNGERAPDVLRRVMRREPKPE
ncbi:MAG: NAD(P)-dependent glycerol-3-phosphate dehydrogenase [Geodermatophilaceae bacterium]|nr:NAD(P)-dependent glycerol-3-phosphate dehydrogenase [Geodermatophilaceae bacterium]